MEPTGSVWDEFLPIYAAMALPGPLRRGYVAAEVDAMEIPLVGSLLRVGHRPRTIEEDAHDMLRKRMEWEALPPDVKAHTPMPSW